MSNIDSTHKINNMVVRLNRHIPFNPDHSEIYEEFQQQTFLHVETAAERFLVNYIKQGGHPLIILTGDAGHGKTHLVRHMLKSLGVDDDAVMQVLQDKCKGVPFEVQGRRMAIHKDLSELTPGDAARLLGRVEELGCPLVVCVNEGRLRALLSQDEMRHTTLARHILKGLESDKVEPEPGVVLLNLNWQMVSLPGGIMHSLLRDILDGRRWKTCQQCRSKDHCPILANRTILNSTEHKHRLEMIRQLYEVVELLGEVVTIRQVLIHLAFLMTGNASCEDVHKMSADKDCSHLSHTSTLFGAGAPEHFVRTHGLFERLRRLDPAYCANRAVDETLQQPEHRSSILPVEAPDRHLRDRGYHVDLRQQLAPVNLDLDDRGHVDIESRFLRRGLHILRRHHLLETENTVEVAGFRHVGAFLDLLRSTKLRSRERNRYTNLIANGLHRLQYLPVQKNNLYIVDPVSLRARAETSVIARSLRRQALKLKPELPPVMVDGEAAIDAQPRRLLLEIEDNTLALGLLDFEFLCSCAEGLASREFFTHTVRRLTNFLLRVAEEEGEEEHDYAEVFFRGEILSLSVDDDSITSG